MLPLPPFFLSRMRPFNRKPLAKLELLSYLCGRSHVAKSSLSKSARHYYLSILTSFSLATLLRERKNTREK